MILFLQSWLGDADGNTGGSRGRPHGTLCQHGNRMGNLPEPSPNLTEH
jgi:hypothetical protein